MTRAVILLLSLACLGSCSGGGGGGALGTSQQLSTPTLQYRTNPNNLPGYVSPCAGGQPSMQYNCPAGRN